MSYTFSRRAFLKYSAATAVAVAGASLLGGCEYQDPKNPVCKTLPGAIKSDLQVICRPEKHENRETALALWRWTLSLPVQTPSRWSPAASLLPSRTPRASRSTSAETTAACSILDAENSLIEQKKPVTLHLAAANFPELKDGDTVLFQYIPIRENSEFSMTWEITKEVYEKFITDQSTSKN